MGHDTRVRRNNMQDDESLCKQKPESFAEKPHRFKVEASKGIVRGE